MLLVLAFALPGGAAAQGRTPRLWGRVTAAETGQGIAGAEVLLVAPAARSVRTDSSGAWQMAVPGDASLTIRVRHPGRAYRELQLGAGRTGAVDVALERLAIALDAIVVTASRRAQRLADVAVETSLLDSAVLRRSGAPDLAAVLSEQSGFQPDGGIPAGAGVQLRGFDSRRVLVLLDGQPLVGRVNGNFDLSRLPVSMVERVEVVKGPQSTLYGSDALGGVVNIITRRAEVPGWSAGVATSAGSRGRLEGSGNLAWRRGDVGATVDAGARTLDLAPGVAGDAGTYARRGNGTATLTWDASARTRATASLLAVREAQRYRTGQLYHFADNTQLAGRFGAERTQRWGRVSAALHGTSFAHLSRASTLDAPVSRDGERDQQSLWQGEVVANAAWGDLALDGGLQLRREGITADRVLERRRDVSSAEPFAQLTVTRGGWSLVPGLRLTFSDQWGRFAAPRLAAMWRPTPQLALRAGVGRGFRAPDFKELYLDFVNSAAGYAVQGNPDLRPERSTSLSSGVEVTGRHTWGRVGLFHTAYRDFIETAEPDAAGTYTYRNLDRGTMQGVELEAGMVLGTWRVESSADLLATRDAASGARLLGRPRGTVRGTVGGTLWRGIGGSASLVYTGRTPIDRTVDGATLERGGWARVDARVTRALPSGLTLSLGAQNLLDRRMGATWPGYTGRLLLTSLEWRGGAGPR